MFLKKCFCLRSYPALKMIGGSKTKKNVSGSNVDSSSTERTPVSRNVVLQRIARAT